MKAIEKINEMKNQAFLYNNQEVVIIGYCENTGSE